jgi:hypothetical protein
MPNYTMQLTTLRVAADRERRWIDGERYLVGLLVVLAERHHTRRATSGYGQLQTSKITCSVFVLWPLGVDCVVVSRGWAGAA